MSTLFDPIRIGDIELATRLCMAPLTRNRASPGQLPNDLMRQYYEPVSYTHLDVYKRQQQPHVA